MVNPFRIFYRRLTHPYRVCLKHLMAKGVSTTLKDTSCLDRPTQFSVRLLRILLCWKTKLTKTQVCCSDFED